MKDNNKRSIIFVIVILIALLLIFALIRGCDKKEEPKEKLKDKDKTELVTEDVTIEDMDNYYVEAAPKATKVVKVEKKEQILTLNLVGEDVVFIDQDTDYIEEGAFASDTIDGTLTDKVVRKVYRITYDPISLEEVKTEVDDVDTTIAGAVYEVVYTITNSNKETKTVSRRVFINVINAVELNLIGSKVITVELGETYTELGVIAIETIDGVGSDLTVETKYYEYDELTGTQTEGVLDTNKIAEYIINYKAIDSDGLEHTVTRTVKVVDTTAPVITAKDEYKFRMDVDGGELDLETLYTVEDKDTNVTITSEIINLKNNTIVDAIALGEEGEYSVIVKAIDSSNNDTTVTFNVIVGEDVTAPEVVINSKDIVNTDTSKNEVTIKLEVNDDYTETDNIKLYYTFTEIDATVENLSKDAPIYRDQNDLLTWTEVTDNEINYEYDATTATDKALLVKAEDEAGNYSIYNYNTKQD